VVVNRHYTCSEPNLGRSGKEREGKHRTRHISRKGSKLIQLFVYSSSLNSADPMPHDSQQPSPSAVKCEILTQFTDSERELTGWFLFDKVMDSASQKKLQITAEKGPSFPSIGATSSSLEAKRMLFQVLPQIIS
jgi:hypothetical protein